MALITDSLFVDVILGLILLLYLMYWFITNNYDYWDVRGIPNVKGKFMVEVIMGKKSQSEAFREIYQQFYGKKLVGMFQFKQPMIMVRDLDLIHKILVKDFTFFQDRGQPVVNNDPLSTNLFNLKGYVWRSLRHKLTATFTTGKLKGMFEQVSKCGDNLIEKIEELSKGNNEIECKNLTFEFTLDVISSCAFGVQFKPNSPEFNEFKTIVKNIFRGGIFTFAKYFVLLTCPKLANIANLKPFPKTASDYFVNLTKTTLKYRKDNNIQRNDYFQLLMTLKEQEESGKDMGLTISDATEEDSVINQMQYAGQINQPIPSNVKLFTEETICGNTFIFLIGGSESTASSISLVLFELTQHIDIQTRLQQEVDSALARHGGWSYDTLKDMDYLEQVIQETQRMHPVIPILIRECVQPYKVPDTDLVIEKGTLVSIPLAGLHKDPQYYPDPEQFKPERFEGNKFKPNSAYLPFGDGPRICIAMRFAVLEVKACVAKIMSHYTVKLSSRTPVPLKFDVRSFTPSVKDGIWMSFEKRKPITMPS